MPDIDNDLFELLSLIGFALIVIVGLALLGAVGKLRKSLDRASAEMGREAAWRGAEPAEGHVATSTAGLSAAEAEMPDVGAGEEADQPAPAAAVSAGPGVVPAAEAAERPEPEPAVAEAPQPEPEPAPAAKPVATAGEEEPEGQPFERDGRWWFRRGDELLVYDEMSGQWQPAPQQATSTTNTQEVPAGEAEHSLGAQAPVEAAQPGAFWKCPSCGAVNGSTATSCRMCFTPRP
jgi:hypothetical protein